MASTRGQSALFRPALSHRPKTNACDSQRAPGPQLFYRIFKSKQSSFCTRGSRRTARGDSFARCTAPGDRGRTSACTSQPCSPQIGWLIIRYAGPTLPAQIATGSSLFSLIPDSLRRLLSALHSYSLCQIKIGSKKGWGSGVCGGDVCTECGAEWVCHTAAGG